MNPLDFRIRMARRRTAKPAKPPAPVAPSTPRQRTQVLPLAERIAILTARRAALARRRSPTQPEPRP